MFTKLEKMDVEVGNQNRAANQTDEAYEFGSMSTWSRLQDLLK